MLINKITLFATLALVIILTTWFFSNYYHTLVFSPLKPDSKEVISFQIEPGEKAISVGERLAQAGLIRSPLFFRFYLRFNQLGGRKIQAGEYQLSPSLSTAQVVEELQHGTFDEKLTIPEGLRLEEIDELLARKFPQQWSKEKLRDFSVFEFEYAFLKDTPENASLEGFLFPDTYLVPQTITPKELVNLMLDNLDQRFEDNLRQNLKAQNLTIYEAVTIASIVEREAKKEKDRPQVAGILIKRLQNNWPLEADATVQYAKANAECETSTNPCNWWPTELTEEDLKIDSPYNTRQVIGLPPGPMANPGLASLKAVVFPEVNDNWYYVSDREGNIYYSKTLEEHNAKVALYAR